MSVLDRQVTEKAFTQQVITLAKLRGWLAYHTHDSRKSPAGFPDLVLVRPGAGTNIADELDQAPGQSFEHQLTYLLDAAISSQAYGHDTGRIIFAELKKEGAYARADQRKWLTALAMTANVEVYVWRPSDWTEISEVLA